MTQKTTLADVASLAGVSSMTASRALRGAKDVAPSTIKKVTRAADTLGYLGNALAQSLAAKRTDLVAVIMPSLTNTVFPEVLAGLTESTESNGFRSVFGLSEYDPGKEYQLIRDLLQWKPAGFVLPGVDQLPEARALLVKSEIPVIQVMDLIANPIGCCVGFSHHQAGYDMADALLARGITKIGYVGAALTRDVRARKRRDGFAERLAEAGLSFKAAKVSDELATISNGGGLTGQLLDQPVSVQAIYYANDDLAAGGVFECMRRMLRVPQDLIIIGFNGLSITDALPVKIVTSRSSRYEMGKIAGDTLAAKLFNQDQPMTTHIRLNPVIDWGDFHERVDLSAAVINHN